MFPQNDTAAAMVADGDDTPRYRIHLVRSGQSIEHLEEKHTLLETLEQKVSIEYQCRSGFCGACRCRLLRGRVSYRQAPLAFLQPGEILPCCCSVQQDLELDL